MFNTTKMKRAAKRRRDQAIKDCKRTNGSKGPKVLRKKINYDQLEEAA